MAMTLNSDIHVWAGDSVKPTSTIRGHKNIIQRVQNLNSNLIVTCDSDGRVLSWNPLTSESQRPEGIFKHAIQITSSAHNSKFLYTASGDLHLMQYAIEEAGLKSTLPELLKTHSSAI